MFCHQTAGQNHNIKRADKCFENVAMFKFLGQQQIKIIYMNNLRAD
jgi:hypothetical protein